MRSLVLISVLLASSTALAAGDDISKVNKSITADAGAEYGDLSTVNGSVTVSEGAVAESVETVNGSVRLRDRASVESAETVNGSVTLGQDVAVADDVSTVNGAITVERGGRIGGKVETVNGRIKIEATEVGNGLSTVNGDVTVGADSYVRGGILIEKPKGNWFNSGKSRPPRVVIGPNATVDGVLDFRREVELYVHTSAKVGTIKGATAKSFSGATP
ncbi:hypothetical protein [Chiayiivirga flava]|uniref:Polymer-forming cytoskeletal protein n=1 Tax=Chiayiivirga flava TaxID=659595 RepID=A0A7W8D7K9_9GAMM|nr:hypothetical protein [Chiayiivirga flava]MBB5208141.1 hypothetical protein [Chiayiivirga flava]